MCSGIMFVCAKKVTALLHMGYTSRKVSREEPLLGGGKKEVEKVPPRPTNGIVDVSC